MLFRSLLVALLILFCSAAKAIDYSVSGFLSLSAVMLDEEGYELSDISDKLSFDNDTIIGGQLSLQFTDNLSATGQLVARGFALDDSVNYQPSLDWLYLTYDVIPELRIRMGRLATPYYAVSEYFEIGAAYPWVRPPLDVYEPAMSPIKNFNGIDVVLRSNWQEWFIMSQVFFGSEKNETDIYDINIHRVAGLSFNLMRGNFSLRIASLQAEVSLDIFDTQDTLTDLRAFASSDSPTINTVIDILESERIDHLYSSIGLNWDNETWFVFSEYNRLTSGKGFTPDGEGMFITLGYRTSSFTPYFTVGDFKSLLGQELKDLAVGSLITSNQILLSVIGEQALEITRTNRRYQRSYALGLRYDLTDDMSIKFEAQRVEPERHTQGLFSSKDETVFEAPEINVYSLVLDVVF